MSTGIEWTDETWNPITGCTKVSLGCRHCYAERMAKRLAGRFGYPEMPHHFDVTLHPDRLEQPLRWKKPRRVFVVSMGDLFHKDVPDKFIHQVFDIMAEAQQHTFQVLTKRPDRMKWFFEIHARWPGREDLFPNVWLGVSVENQATVDERIPLLLQIPAAVWFVSCEPLLGAVDVSPYMPHPTRRSLDWDKIPGRGDGFTYPFTGLDWVIVGGESGLGARPMDPQWVRDIHDQCLASGVPLFFKQHGAWLHETQFTNDEQREKGLSSKRCEATNGLQFIRIGKKAAGCLLDGREEKEWPNLDKLTHNVL